MKRVVRVFHWKSDSIKIIQVREPEYLEPKFIFGFGMEEVDVHNYARVHLLGNTWGVRTERTYNETPANGQHQGTNSDLRELD